MRLTRNTQELRIMDWSGGLNTLFEKNRIKDNETPDCQNVIATKNGVITKKPWTVQYLATQSWSYGVGWLFSFTQYDGSTELLMAHNTFVYTNLSGSFATIKTGLTAGLAMKSFTYDGYSGSATVTGTATGTQTSTTLKDTSKGWSPDGKKGDIVVLAPIAQVVKFTVVSNPADGETIVVGSKVYTFKTSWATGDQINIGAGVNDTATNIETKIDTDTAYTYCTASVSTNEVTCTANTAWVPFAVLGDVAKITITTMTANYYGESRMIKSNTADTLTVDTWNTTPTTAVTTYSIKETDKVIYFMNGTDTCFKYDGTSVVNVPTIPKSKICAVGGYRAYVVPAGEENSVYCSAYDEVENFQNITVTGTGMHIVRPPTPDRIKGLKYKGDTLFIYKENSRWALTWSSDSYGNIVPVLQLVTANMGAYNDSVAEYDNDLLNLAYDGVTTLGAQANYLSTGSGAIRVKSISEKIDSLIDLCTEANKVYNVSYYDGAYYYLALDESGDGKNDVVYIYDGDAWWKWTNNINCMVRHNGVTYYGDTSLGKVFYFDDNITNDDGSAINAYYNTRVFDLGDFDMYKFVYQCNLEFENIQWGITFTVYTENNVSKTNATSSFTVGSTTSSAIGTTVYGSSLYGSLGRTATPVTLGDFKRPRKQLNVFGQTLQLKFSNNTASSTFVLTSANILYKTHGKWTFPVGYKY